jgi:acetolactate synthase-1/3 small subunit
MSMNGSTPGSSSQGLSKRTVIALVQDRPGVLARVAGLFRRRGFNIASLVVGKSERPGFSRMTFEVEGDPSIVSHVARQLDKLIDVVEVTDVTDLDIVWREMALVKVTASAETRGEIMQLVEIFRAKIVDVGAQAIGIETTGDPDKIDSMIALLRPFGVREVMRTGRVAMPRAALEEGGTDGFNVKSPESPLWVAQSTDTGSV